MKISLIILPFSLLMHKKVLSMARASQPPEIQRCIQVNIVKKERALASPVN
jgi:hypothetical protein